MALKVLVRLLASLLFVICIHFVALRENRNEHSSNLNTSHLFANHSISKLTAPTELDPTASLAATEKNISIKIPSHFVPELLTVPESSLKLYSAYLDDRERFYGPAVYVLGIDVSKRYSKGLKGLLTYNNGVRTCVGPSTIEEPCDRKCNGYIHYTKYNVVNNVFKLDHALNSTVYPTLISLTKDCKGSLASKPLTIHPRNPGKSKLDFGVCVQTPLYGKVKVENLVYFIEMNKLLGAQWIMVYSMVRGLENRAELAPYIRQNLLTVVPWPKIFTKYAPTHYFGEILSIHDCLYRSLSWIEHLVLIDQDELIIPRHGRTWSELIGSIPNTYDGYLLLNTYYTAGRNNLKDKVLDKVAELIPTKSSCDAVPYFNRLYRYSCTFPPYRRSKVLIRVDSIKNLDIHAIPRVNKARVYIVPRNITSLFHYRAGPSGDCENKSLIYDPVTLKYERDFILNSGINVCHDDNNNN